MLFDFTRLLFRGGYVVQRWSSPTAKKADIAGHSMRVIKHLSAQREAKQLQVFLPHLHQLFRHADEGVLPAGQRIIDGTTTIGAQVRRKAEDQYLALSLFGRLTHSPHEVANPFLRDL